ncbi:MAG: hypothetical protein PHR39_05230 [Actinomycetota bacterium]|nr:hypothetical protein [Actinomycetota bacterium]
MNVPKRIFEPRKDILDMGCVKYRVDKLFLNDIFIKTENDVKNIYRFLMGQTVTGKQL